MGTLGPKFKRSSESIIYRSINTHTHIYTHTHRYVFYKTNTDQMNQIIISSLDINIGFFHGLQFLDDRAHCVTGKIHVIEVVRQFLLRIVSVINLNFLGAGSLF